MNAPISRFSCTVREGKILLVCGTKPIPFKTLCCGFRLVISSPSNKTLPFFNGRSPNNAFIAVDFPAPFGPTMDDISPFFTPMLQLDTISTEP